MSRERRSGVVAKRELSRYSGPAASTAPARLQEHLSVPMGWSQEKTILSSFASTATAGLSTISSDRKISTLVDKFDGKRFNSPNDLVYKSDGTLYFTDPPYGLTGGDQDPQKDLPFNGVFRYSSGGKLDVLAKDLTRPNGIAFSPDEKVLYISNSDEKRKIWMRYDVQIDGTIANGKVFADVTADTAEGLPDGMKVDSKGNCLRDRSRWHSCLFT